ncbi:MAG TPA: XRE family transcriptional regulator [Phnomibacter sp.]|nr:XRE family transcriptional regulator [Phnomibacter sp.]
MQEDILLQISNRLRALRKEKNVTLQDVADRSGVSKSLVSQIENSRTVPSLLVLMNLIKSLEVDLNAFFKNINLNPPNETVIIKRAHEYQPFEKEHSQGFTYQRILTTHLHDMHVDVVLLTLQPGATRSMVCTEAFELKFVLAGPVVYRINDREILLNTGDTLFFDGRDPHVPVNPTAAPVQMLVIYFFEEER